MFDLTKFNIFKSIDIEKTISKNNIKQIISVTIGIACIFTYILLFI